MSWWRRWRSTRPRHAGELLSPYMDGRLPSAPTEGVRQHLADCPQCRAELEALRETVGLLRRLPATAPPRSFIVRPGLAPAWAPGRIMTWGPRAATAAALFLAVSAALLYTQPWEPVGQPAEPKPAAATPAPEAAPAAAPAREAMVPTPAAPLPAVPGAPRLAPVAKAPPGARVLAPEEEQRRLPGPEAIPEALQAQPAERIELARPQAGVQDRPWAAGPAATPEAAAPAAPVGEAPAEESQPKETHGPRAAAVAAAAGAFLFLLLAGGLLLVRAAQRRGA